jgi:hypothetical protein
MGKPAASGIQIRLAGPGDAAALTELFDAVDRHYWGSAAPSPTAIAEHVRRRVLTATSCEIAIERSCGRFDWTAETGNHDALGFYDRLGARRVEEKVYYRFDGEALKGSRGAG